MKNFMGLAVLGAMTLTGQAALAQDYLVPVFKTQKFEFAVPRSFVLPGGREAADLAKPAPNDTAPNLSSEQVIIVASSNNPNGESISKGQTTTAYDEGGAQMEVGVLEMGYGRTPYITMGGTQLAQSVIETNAQSVIETKQQVCNENGQLKTPCDAGYTVVGYYYIINLSGYQSGQFGFSNSSINNASVTASTTLYIK